MKSTKVRFDFSRATAPAFLEVLDPQQNNTFTDNYLDLPVDCRPVSFITTANWLDPIHPACGTGSSDRTAQLHGDRKAANRQRFLVPRQLEEHGLKAKLVKLPVRNFETVDSGLHARSRRATLEREIAALTRRRRERL